MGDLATRADARDAQTRRQVVEMMYPTRCRLAYLSVLELMGRG